MVLFGTLELNRPYIYSCNIKVIRVNCDFSLNWEPLLWYLLSNIVEHLREEERDLKSYRYDMAVSYKRWTCNVIIIIVMVVQRVSQSDWYFT